MRVTHESGAIPGWGYGVDRISRESLVSLTKLRARVLKAIRDFFEDEGCLEVTTSTLTQMSGSCENPTTMFQLKYYDRTAFLAQSAQLQLEVIMGLLGRSAYTFTTSFRGEDYAEDPSSRRRLTEFSLVEAEGPGWTLDALCDMEERLIRRVVDSVLKYAESDLIALGGDAARLRAMSNSFERITHAEAARKLIEAGFSPPAGGVSEWDFGMREEKELLRLAGNRPMFLTHQPLKIKYFNMSTAGDSALSVDLLAPPIGEICGGGARESDSARVRTQLLESRMLSRMRQLGGDESEFDWYIGLLEKPGLPPRAGFGLGLERLVGFLIGTDDILTCLEFPATDRHLFP
jgi:asparaginyl-tRNA synthetase